MRGFRINPHIQVVKIAKLHFPQIVLKTKLTKAAIYRWPNAPAFRLDPFYAFS